MRSCKRCDCHNCVPAWFAFGDCRCGFVRCRMNTPNDVVGKWETSVAQYLKRVAELDVEQLSKESASR